MQISLRSHLIAGTAAVIGATAITATGVATVRLDLPVKVSAMADVELTAFLNPVLVTLDTLDKTNFYLFSQAEPPVSDFPFAGLFPQYFNAGVPILSQLGLNASEYLENTGYALTNAVRKLAWAVDALPANINYAAAQAQSGNLAGALYTLQFALVNPVQAALYDVLDAGVFVVGGVGTRAAAVITSIADWVPTTIRAVVDSVTVVFNAAGAMVNGVVLGAATLNPELVWNSLVTGLLGGGSWGFNTAKPSGIPGALIDQTIGEGTTVRPDPYNPAFTVTVPSMRQQLVELVTGVKDGLAEAVPVPGPPPIGPYPTPIKPTPGPLVPPVAARAAAAVAEPTVTVPHSDSVIRARHSARSGAAANPPRRAAVADM